MSLFLDKLPTILILAVLVGIFLSLQKHTPSTRSKLWIIAWALIFLHFFVQIFETRTGFIENLIETIDLAALELAGVVFMVSLARSVEDRLRRNILLATLAFPVALDAAGATFNWPIRWALCAALAVFFFGCAAFALFAHHRPSRFNAILAVVLILVGAWVVPAQWRGNSDLGVNAILTLTFGISGLLYWKRYPRLSPGVITVAGGFLCWGAVFPIATILAKVYPTLQVNLEIWNVPKFFVAFGMILAVVEEKSRIVEASGAQQHAENAMLLRFSRITSRLLSGADPSTVCGEIAGAITESASFGCAALLLAREDGTLILAGSSGYSLASGEELEQRVAGWSVARIREMCGTGERIGNNSFRVETDLQATGANAKGREIKSQSEWIVPLASSRGMCLGWVALSSPKDPNGPNSAEIAKVEMIAADLAVTIENTRLHSQLVRSEKLAALGQLVAGVAHELNNPLTGIIGYTELLSDEVTGESAVKKVTKLGNEARRMQRIVSGLLRFARQGDSSGRSAEFEATLQDALHLREFHLRKLQVQVQTEIEPQLPLLAIGEDELKQILLNLLANASDALEENGDRQLRIHAARRNGRVVFGFEDSGPGFLDLNRAFDPFYTTKPVGKGTGLGLSICYGIVRECGGDIHLANRQPYGASVTVEIPAATSQVVLPTPA